ncbi:MAG: ORF6N domain-containing protein [Thomasclavelia sp.]
MNKLRTIEHKKQRVLLFCQLAESYGTSTEVLAKNFNRNKKRYTKRKHYFALEGKVKKEFIGQKTICSRFRKDCE